MRKFLICPINDIPLGTKDNIFISVDSYLKKAIKKGKELYGNNFILRERKSDVWGDFYESNTVYDSNGVIIIKNGIKVK